MCLSRCLSHLSQRCCWGALDIASFSILGLKNWWLSFSFKHGDRLRRLTVHGCDVVDDIVACGHNCCVYVSGKSHIHTTQSSINWWYNHKVACKWHIWSSDCHSNTQHACHMSEGPEDKRVHYRWSITPWSCTVLLQRVSIACYAERCISYDRFCLTVRPSDRLSHAGIMPKRLQLRSCGLHWWIAPWL